MNVQRTPPRAQHAIAVGRIILDGRQTLVPVSHEELDRARAAMLAIFRTYHFRTGRAVLSTSLFGEGLYFMPIERAASSYGLVVTSADASFSDAARVESAVRRFDTAAVIGVDDAVLDGLAALGFDPMKVFEGVVVWARGGAYDRLAGHPQRRRMVLLGPTLGMECAAGHGAHVDRMAWTLDNAEDGEVLVSSRLPALRPFERFRTGVRARITHDVCRCGNSDPRLLFPGDGRP